MATLNHVLEAILESVTVARRGSDRLSARLCDDYWRDPILREFPVPRATISSIKLDLKFAIASTVAAVHFDEDAVGAAAETIVRKGMDALRSAFHDKAEATSGNDRATWQ